jgi:hypothetical protein
MASVSPETHETVLHPVIIRPESTGRFSAEPVGLPELRVDAANAEEAVAQVQKALTEWSGSVVQVPVKSQPAGVQELLDLAGHAKDDPDFDVYLDEIRRCRQQADARQ